MEARTDPLQRPSHRDSFAPLQWALALEISGKCMNGFVVVHRDEELSADEQAALEALTLAVYPTDEWRDWPGWQIEWSRPEWRVRVFDGDGQLSAHVGLIVRSATIGERPVIIGGIGGVKTHPQRRGRGFATAALKRAQALARELGNVDIGHLVCEQAMMPFYTKLGWRPFLGTTLVTQRGKPCEFVFLPGMVHDFNTPAADSGVLNLKGPPW